MFFLWSLYLLIFSILSFFMFLIFLFLNLKIITEWLMFNFISMKIELILYLDWMSMMFFSTIFLISSMVIIYSLNYMNNDMFLNRFMYLILIFVISMIFMILSPNLFSILLGWDGLGLSSYCLVIYYQNMKSFNSGMITIMMNRFGDICLIISISLILIKGSLNFMLFNKLNNIFLILIFLATITKSAQIPFSTWLPLAMAAPTPISSLVHSSTLVTAGIYLLIRFNFLFNNSFLYFIMIMSCFTMFMASSTAIFEYDLKKIIALSTLSQLSLMLFTISLNLNTLSFFHLINHAMFKSLLFLCSGILIHNYFNNQDIRLISFMNLNMPMIYMIFNLASLTLCGLPFLTGFYSKDFIIEMFNMKKNNMFMFFLLYLSMSLTLIYSFRLMFFISLKNSKISFFNLFKLKNLMNYSIMILMFLSIFYGSMLNWLIFNSLNMIFLNYKLMLMIYLFMMVGLLMSMILFKFNFNFKIMKWMKFKIYFINFMWFLPFMFKNSKINMFNFNNKFNNFLDKGWLEYIIYKKMFILILKLNNFKMMKFLNFMMIISCLMYMFMFILFM